MNNAEFTACMARAKEINGESRDMKPLDRSILFCLAAVEAMMEHSELQSVSFRNQDPILLRIVQAAGLTDDEIKEIIARKTAAEALGACIPDMTRNALIAALAAKRGR